MELGFKLQSHGLELDYERFTLSLISSYLDGQIAQSTELCSLELLGSNVAFSVQEVISRRSMK